MATADIPEVLKDSVEKSSDVTSKSRTSVTSVEKSSDVTSTSRTSVTSVEKSSDVTSTSRTSVTSALTWQEGQLTLVDLVKDALLPRVAEINALPDSSLPPGLKIYASQPILLYARTKKRQGHARTIYKERGGAYFEVGQTLLIPEDCEGWFELVPTDFLRARCYRTIGDIAKDMPRKIFTRSNIKALRVVNNDAGQQDFKERKIPAGSVISVNSIFTATWKSSVKSGMFKKKTTEFVTTDVKYLKVISPDQKELLIPFETRGKFNAVFEPGKHNPNSVYRMKDILTELELPVKVRLLFGKAPVVPCIFTGMLIVRSKPEQESIVGSTVLNKRNVLFEIPTSTPCAVKVASNAEEVLGEVSTYVDAQKLCRKYAMTFSSMIKLSLDLDTNQSVVQHVPSDPTLQSSVDEALRAFDLITDISLTDGDPRDVMLGESDTDSMQSEDQSPLPPHGTLVQLRESHLFDTSA